MISELTKPVPELVSVVPRVEAANVNTADFLQFHAGVSSKPRRKFRVPGAGAADSRTAEDPGVAAISSPVPLRRGLVVPRMEAYDELTAEALGLPIRRLHPDFAVWSVDVRTLLAKQPFWQEEIMGVGRQAKRKKIIGGEPFNSMAPDGFVTWYQPTTTNKVKEALPWLVDYFNGPFRLLAQLASGDNSLTLGRGPATLNINYSKTEDYVKDRKVSYELHWDRNDITAALFATDMEEGEGGGLRFHERRDIKTNTAHGRTLTVRPRAGMLLIFKGSHPHEGLIATTNKPRGLVPGDFFSEDRPEIISFENTMHDRQIGVEE
jgi:hypothetical protein